MSESAGFPVVLSAPSGGGKNTVAATLLERSPLLVRSRSVTTRPIREGEKLGRDYEFVGQEEFLRRKERNQFVEWAHVHGHFYGTPRIFLEEACARGECPLLVIDVQGGMSIKTYDRRAVLFFLMPHSLEEIERRLRTRGTESEEQVATRLRNARTEIIKALKYDYLVLNESVKTAAEQIYRTLVTNHSLHKS